MLTSPAIVVIRRAVISSNVSADRSLAGTAGSHARRTGAQAVEGVVLQQLALHAPGGRRALAVADEQDELAVGHAAQQPLDERRAHEPRRSRDGDPRARQRLGDHGPMYSTSLPIGRERVLGHDGRRRPADAAHLGGAPGGEEAVEVEGACVRRRVRSSRPGELGANRAITAIWAQIVASGLRRSSRPCRRRLPRHRIGDPTEPARRETGTPASRALRTTSGTATATGISRPPMRSWSERGSRR